MELRKKIRRWWTRKPLPKERHSLYEWMEFVRKAPCWQVEEVYENADKYGIAFSERLLRPFHRRMAKCVWPRVSMLFLLFNRKKVLRLSKGESLMQMVKNKFDCRAPKYVVDEKRQILGIAISENCVIDQVSNHPFGLWGASQEEDVFLSMYDAVILASCINEVNNMLWRFDLPQIKGKYWVNGCYLFNAKQAIRFPDDETKMFEEVSEHGFGCYLSKF